MGVYKHVNTPLLLIKCNDILISLFNLIIKLCWNHTQQIIINSKFNMSRSYPYYDLIILCKEVSMHLTLLYAYVYYEICGKITIHYNNSLKCDKHK